MGNDLQKKYGLPTAIALVVGIVIVMRRETTLGVFQRFVMPALSIRAASSFARRPSCRTAGTYSPT